MFHQADLHNSTQNTHSHTLFPHTFRQVVIPCHILAIFICEFKTATYPILTVVWAGNLLKPRCGEELVISAVVCVIGHLFSWMHITRLAVLSNGKRQNVDK